MCNDCFILTGSRVALREMLLSDQHSFQKWLAENEELRQQIDDHHVPTMDDQMQWFEGLQKRTDRKFFSIITLPNEELIGNGGFVAIDLRTKQATFRITLGNTAHHGKGYGTEATRLILRYGFEDMGLEKIILKVLKRNTRAVGMYTNVGFVPIEEESGERLVMGICRESFTL